MDQHIIVLNPGHTTTAEAMPGPWVIGGSLAVAAAKATTTRTTPARHLPEQNPVLCCTRSPCRAATVRPGRV
jgi:hypothetical protein